jgi:hypothetical protein
MTSAKPVLAFPQTHGLGNDEYVHYYGMTLRDYFAAKAMARLYEPGPMGQIDKILRAKPGVDVMDCVAIMAYAQADAMLKARGD